MDLQIEQAEKEAQRRLEEECKRAENFKQERQYGILTRFVSSTKEKWGERRIEMQPAIPTLVDVDEWLHARLHAKTMVCEPLPTFGKPSTGRRSRFRRPPRKEEQHGNIRREPHRFSTLATGATTGKQSQPIIKNCLVCDSKHAIEKCEKFLVIDVNQRAQPWCVTKVQQKYCKSIMGHYRTDYTLHLPSVSR
ncbi:hypothetical protein ACROYT_G019343 [Oculina patagonica]